MSSISSHVLDTTAGRPAGGMVVRLDVHDASATPAERWNLVASATTDEDGRVRRLAPEGGLAAGTYRVTFETGPYLEAQGHPVFYPRVEVVFVVAAGVPHYHVPLLLSPFGYSTYRGS